MTTEDEVRAASDKFYSALNRMLYGDAGPLGDIWSHSATSSHGGLVVQRSAAGFLTSPGTSVSPMAERTAPLVKGRWATETYELDSQNVEASVLNRAELKLRED
jgi:hypothetical protein